MALAKKIHNQFYRNQILMQPIKMTTQHAPRRAYLFSSFRGQKLVAQGNFFIFFGFCVPIMFHMCSHKVPSDIPDICSTSSQCVNPNMFPIAPHIKRYVLPKIELS
jgi:hypothetical protein